MDVFLKDSVLGLKHPASRDKAPHKAIKQVQQIGIEAFPSAKLFLRAKTWIGLAAG